MTERYRVEGELVLRAQAGLRAVGAMTSRLQQLRANLAGSQSVAGGLVRSLVGMGAAYMGINAVVGGMRSLVGGAVEFQAGLEGTRIGLSAVMSAVEHIPFEQAQRESEALFSTIQTDALRSVATSRELFDIFQSIYGPLRAGGLAMDDIRTVMLDTVSAASALNVDFPQASRDIQMMARGAAGMHVRLFSMLRATGAIAQDAETFNHLSQPERIAIMQRALGQFSQAADAYGQSFAGVTSTFKDIVESFLGAGFGPVFGRIRYYLSRTNDLLLENRRRIVRVLQVYGEVLAQMLDRVVSAGRSAFEYLTERWGSITSGLANAVSWMRRLAPMLERAAILWAGLSLARAAAPAALGLASGVGSAVSGAASAAGWLAGAAGPAAEAAAAGGAGMAGMAGAGGLAAISALAEALAPLVVVALVVVNIISAIVSVFYVLYDQFDAFLAMFKYLEPVLNATFAEFEAIGGNLWDILRPSLTLIGTTILMILVPAVILGIAALRGFANYLHGITEMWALYSRVFEARVVNPFRNFMLRMGIDLAALTHGAFGFSGAVAEVTSLLDELNRKRSAEEARGRLNRPGTGTSPRDRNQTINNFQGSRININQEFREADPDRVLVTMVEDINRQAEARIQSNFVPALTR